MTKKTDISSIKNIGAGILDSISGIEEQKSKVVNNEKSEIKEIPDNNKVKEQKGKRSFMLSETTTQRLNLLKLCMNNKDLSSIVEEAIEVYFEKNKKSIESLIDIYNKVK